MVYREALFEEVRSDGSDQWIFSFYGELGRKVEVVLGICQLLSIFMMNGAFL